MEILIAKRIKDLMKNEKAHSNATCNRIGHRTKFCKRLDQRKERTEH